MHNPLHGAARKPDPETYKAQNIGVETRGLEPLTPALQRRCSTT
jgi:hypothetical protein